MTTYQYKHRTNKHVKRIKNSHGYQMVEDNTLEAIPLERWVSSAGLIVIWCTNNSKHRSTVMTMMERWGVSKVKTWFWVKARMLYRYFQYLSWSAELRLYHKESINCL